MRDKAPERQEGEYRSVTNLSAVTKRHDVTNEVRRQTNTFFSGSKRVRNWFENKSNQGPGKGPRGGRSSGGGEGKESGRASHGAEKERGRRATRSPGKAGKRSRGTWRPPQRSPEKAPEGTKQEWRRGENTAGQEAKSLVHLDLKRSLFFLTNVY